MVEKGLFGSYLHRGVTKGALGPPGVNLQSGCKQTQLAAGTVALLSWKQTRRDGGSYLCAVAWGGGGLR